MSSSLADGRSPDSVFLSPHLDDAVLGAGALIAREVAQGRRVEVWTAFTAGPASAEIKEPSLRVFGDYATRCKEDERALQHLGAGHRWLGLRERAFREPPLRKTAHVFRTPELASDFPNLETLSATISALLEDTEVRVYAPLGVGNHIDHVEVALAAMRVMLERQAFQRFTFYEDFYAAGTAFRRRHFVTRQQAWSLWDSPAWASPGLGLMLRACAWAARGPGIDEFLPEAARLNWTCAPASVTDFEPAKLQAIAEYGSQIAVLGGIKSLKRFVQRMDVVCGGELTWRAFPS
jgi:LmbE family N-acetylglucosaminyl deacetylase